MNKFIAFIGWSACMICLTVLGCEKEGQAPSAPKVVTKRIIKEDAGAVVKPAETKAPGDVAAATSPEEKVVIPKPLIAAPPPEGIYNPEGKIDPFEPAAIASPEEAAASKKVHTRPLTPLERVDVGQLKLSGIIRAPSGNKALVEESSGKGYIVSQGTFIGIHSGQVVQILNDSIVIEEELEDDLGKTYVRQREMKLQKPPGEE